MKILKFIITLAVSICIGYANANNSSEDSSFVDYQLMKEQIHLIAKSINKQTTSDSTISFINETGYKFDIKVYIYEYDIYKTHKLFVTLTPPLNIPYGYVDMPKYFEIASSEILKFHDYYLIDFINSSYKIMKEKMTKPFEKLKNGQEIEKYYHDSCFGIFHKDNYYNIYIESCNDDFPNESMSFEYSGNDKFIFEYSFTAP